MIKYCFCLEYKNSILLNIWDFGMGGGTNSKVKKLEFYY